MAQSLVSTVLNQLATITLQEVKLVRGVDAEIENLTSNLKAIQAVLEDAEEREMKEATVKLWLEKLKDVSYDIEDVLDEWNTAIRKQNAEKVCSSCTVSFGFCFHQVCLRHDIARKIEKLSGRLAAIAFEKNAFNFKSGKGSQEPRLLTTSVIVDVSEVFDREQDTDNIKTMLLSGNNEGATLRIISIVGMGGLGKTTLARLAFNDAQVESYFDERIWVCVSDPFDEKRIAIEILESVKGEKTDLVGMDNILKKIRELISGKKILLVLDDVWAEDSIRWEPLKGSLKCGSPESRILLTTRKEKVAIDMGSRRTDMVSVRLLSEEGCWKLFTHLAFSERPSGECKTLEDVGRKIVEKCKGLPLAVKTIGSLLRFKKNKEQWQSVLDSEMWEIKEVEEGVFLPLMVSYYDLPSALKQCFSFCAVFPEDYVINKGELIRLWMAQGFLDETQHKEMEMVGEEYFNELVMRSFFHDLEKNENDDIVKCKLHDSVHSFVRFLTKKECFFMKVEDDDSKKTKKFSLPCKTIRHPFLLMERDAKFHVPMNNWEKVRTLLVGSNEWNKSKIVLNSMDKLRCIRILRFEATLTKKNGNLIHLRYLNLSNGSFTTLPEAVCDLYNLQTLDITSCTTLRSLPLGIGKLENLRHLENQSTDSLVCIPKGMRRLTHLQTLREFHVSAAKSAFKIEDLGNLGKLRGSLRIRGLQRADASKVRAARLSTMVGLRDLTLDFDDVEEKSAGQDEGVGLRDLTLDFDDVYEKSAGQDEAVVLEALQPPPSLEILRMCESKGSTLFSSWMTSLTMLKTVELSNCCSWESLPPLGKLLSLESLKIGRLTKVKKVGEDFLGIEREEEGQSSSSSSSSSSIIAFPKLKVLAFNFMDELEYWEYENLFTGTSRGGITIMPLLCSLQILHCPKLKAVPHHHFRQLRELEIVGCGILLQRFAKQTGIDWHYISHIPKCTLVKRERAVLKVAMDCFKSRSKAMKLAAIEDGVVSVCLRGREKDRLEVIGDGIDFAQLLTNLRKKVGHTNIIILDEHK